MARRKQTKRPEVPSDAEILDQLRANFYALIGLQTASGRNTEAGFAELDRASRKNVRSELREKFAGLSPDQIERLRIQAIARGKKTR